MSYEDCESRTQRTSFACDAVEIAIRAVDHVYLLDIGAVAVGSGSRVPLAGESELNTSKGTGQHR